jgi:putative tricarboxylic transport membrane protein
MAVPAGLATIALVTGCSNFGGEGDAGNYPSRPVTFSVGSEPGSGWDATARAIVESLEKEGMTDSNITVQNQPGAVGCVLLNRMVDEYAGEEYQIAMTSTPLFSNELRGQCDKDYQDVTMIARLLIENFLVAVPADSPYADLPALLDAVQADPQSVPIGASGDDQLPFALLVKAAGGDPAQINFIEFESGGEYLTALLNGDVVASVSGVTEYGAQIDAGELKGLAVLRDERLEAPLDDIPTAVELGYDVTLSNWRGVYGPPDMPEEAVTYWSEKLDELLKSEAWTEIAERNQWETSYLTGDEYAEFLEGEHQQIQDALTSIGATG